MDSKFRKTVIGVSVCMVFLVFSLVLGLNIYENGGFSKQDQGVAVSANVQMPNISTGTTHTEADLKAFLQDETFFDEESVEPLLLDEENATRLTLAATSVQKDLRVQILDSNGELVTGEGFFITIDGVGEFKDLDQDGVIYIGELDAGDYYVSIQELEGYRIPLAATKVKVKEKLEYAAISDIDLFIKSEEDVNLEQDDVTTHNVSADTDNTERMEEIPTVDGAVLGIDVSSWNKEIDWNSVKAAGVKFAIIRCGFRGYTSGSLVEDKYFRQNILEANEAGIQVGVYFFTQAISEVEAVEEASMAITLCRDYNLTYPVFIDTEGTGGNGRADGLDKATRTLVCDAFCKTMENAGYRSGVYASKNWLNNNLDVTKLNKYHTWLAEYKENATYENTYHIWQYTSNGWVNGITGRVDMNLSYLGY